MSFEAKAWLWKPSETTQGGSAPVEIDRCRQLDGSYKYAVRQAGAVLSKGGEWEYEPIPSSRDDAFFRRCRFDSWEDAANAILKHCKSSGRFAEAVRTVVR